MSQDLDFTSPPFSLLDAAQRQQAGGSMDIAFFNPGDTLIEPGSQPEGLFVILKGLVEESEKVGDTGNASVVAQYRDGDHFGSLAILRGHARHRYTAAEETLVQLMPRQIFADLVHANSQFGEYFHRDLATRSKFVARSSAHRDLVGFSLARIDERSTREALIVSAGTTVRETIRIMRAGGSNCVLVERGERFGMVTRTDLLDAVADGQDPLDRDVAGIATFSLATVEPGAYLFDALITMTRRHIERVVVMRGERLFGIVELADVLGFLSSHSHIVGLKIAGAQNVAELGMAAEGMFELVRSLFGQQVRIRFIMDLLAALNRRIIARLFELTIPPDIAGKVCLLVIGSEGRGEQVMRTDQNNALVLSDELDWPDRVTVLNSFTERMRSLGYPHSPRNIMVSNPAWVMSARKWRKRLGDWITTRDSDGIFALSAMLDASPVAGDRTLFDALAKRIVDTIPKTADFIAALLAPLADNAAPPVLFDKTRREATTINIKTVGIFPLVHGVRTFALEQGIAGANTFARLEKLAETGAIEPSVATDLDEALSFFMQVRLQQQLDRHDRAAGEAVNPLEADSIEIARLTRPEVDLLRAALNVVRDFRRDLLARFSTDVG